MFNTIFTLFTPASGEALNRTPTLQLVNYSILITEPKLDFHYLTISFTYISPLWSIARHQLILTPSTRRGWIESRVTTFGFYMH